MRVLHCIIMNPLLPGKTVPAAAQNQRIAQSIKAVIQVALEKMWKSKRKKVLMMSKRPGF
jgi:hypothetical protein